jgi:hypothetical protein
VVERLDPVVVHRIGGVDAVETPDQRARRDVRLGLLDLLPERVALLGLAVVGGEIGARLDAVQGLRDAIDLRQRLGREDRPFLHLDGDCDDGGGAEGLRELVLGVDEGVVGIEGALARVDAHHRSREGGAECARDRVDGRIEEEEGGEDQEDPDRPAIPGDEPGELEGLGFAGVELG